VCSCNYSWQRVWRRKGWTCPSADAVVRCDPVASVRSHVQARGRARRADSTFYAFLEKSVACTCHDANHGPNLGLAFKGCTPEPRAGDSACTGLLHSTL